MIEKGYKFKYNIILKNFSHFGLLKDFLFFNKDKGDVTLYDLNLILPDSIPFQLENRLKKFKRPVSVDNQELLFLNGLIESAVHFQNDLFYKHPLLDKHSSIVQKEKKSFFDQTKFLDNSSLNLSKSLSLTFGSHFIEINDDYLKEQLLKAIVKYKEITSPPIEYELEINVEDQLTPERFLKQSLSYHIFYYLKELYENLKESEIKNIISCLFIENGIFDSYNDYESKNHNSSYSEFKKTYNKRIGRYIKAMQSRNLGIKFRA